MKRLTLFVVLVLVAIGCSAEPTRPQADGPIGVTRQAESQWCSGAYVANPAYAYDYYGAASSAWYEGAYVGNAPEPVIGSWPRDGQGGVLVNFGNDEFLYTRDATGHPTTTLLANDAIYTRSGVVDTEPGSFVVTKGAMRIHKCLWNGLGCPCLRESLYDPYAHCAYFTGTTTTYDLPSARALMQSYYDPYGMAPDSYDKGARLGFVDGRIKLSFRISSLKTRSDVSQGITLFARYRTENDLYAATWRAWEDKATIKEKFCTDEPRRAQYIANNQTPLSQDAYTDLTPANGVTAPHLTLNVWHTIELRVNAFRLLLLLDGTQVANVTAPYDPNPWHPWGNFGFRLDDVTAYVDDVYVGPDL